MDVTGKRVLVTGGSSGIGLALSEAFLARGARVVICGRRKAALEDAAAQLGAAGGDVHQVDGDVAVDADRDRVLAFALATLGGLDVLVNNAGVVRAGRLEAISEAEIRKLLEVDLLAPILLTRSALPHLRQGGQSLIVNISSAGGLNGVPFYSVYAGAKSGLARFGEAMRRELKGEGVHVLNVFPIATDTPMMASSKAGPELGFGREPAEAVAEAVMDGIATGAFDVIRGGEARAKIIALNRDDPEALDQRFLAMKPDLEEACRDHSKL
jgi:uncharacterized oxidoreductase